MLSFDAQVKEVGNFKTVVHQLQEVRGLLRILTGGGDTPCGIHGRACVQNISTGTDRDGTQIFAGLCGPVCHVASGGASSEEGEYLSLHHGISYSVAVADGIRKRITFHEPVAMHLTGFFVSFCSVPVFYGCAVFNILDTAVCNVGSVSERVHDVSIGKLRCDTVTHGNRVLGHSALYDLAEQFVVIFGCCQDFRDFDIVLLREICIVKKKSAGRGIQGSRISINIIADCTGMDQSSGFFDHGV